jgi:hypothetical protein
MNFGDIYCVTSPSGKKYVGQCVKFLSNGKKWGFENRWKQHIRDACKGKDYCRLLNNAIRKYSPDNFKIELLKECTIDELDFFENYYIDQYNTMVPNGYNLVTGKTNSRQSDETKRLKSASLKGKNKNKVYPKRSRCREEDNVLPKYVRHYLDSSGKEGYRVSNHPKLKDRSFLANNMSMEEKLALAMQYVNVVETR